MGPPGPVDNLPRRAGACGRVSGRGRRCRQSHGVSVSEQPARLAVRSVDDLVGLVPYLMGFHPRESLVAMVLEEGRLHVTARVDLAIAGHPDELEGLLGRLFARFPAAEVWFLAYTEDEERGWAALDACAQLVGLVRLGRLIQVGGKGWRADCPEGPWGEISGAVSATAAEASVLGLAPLTSRERLADAVAGPPDGEVGDLLAAFEATDAELAALGARGRNRLLRNLLRTPAVCRVKDCVRLALLVHRPECQLAVLRSLGNATAEQQLGLWRQVVRHSLVSHRPTVLGLLGMAAWQTGDGALQVVCLEELDRIDPAVPLAAVLEWLNRNVVPPGDWDELRGMLLGSLAEWLRPADPPTSRRGR